MLGKQKRATPAGTAAAPLMYWLALVAGLAALTVQRIDQPAQVLPIAAGGILGTALGQWLAAGRARLWLTVLVAVNLVFFGAIGAAPLWVRFQGNSVDMLELAVLAFVPATVCAHLALGERTALAGFWFPALPWTLAVLDHADGATLEDRGALFAAPAVLLLFFLYTRELRRVALWRASGATVKLAASRPPVVLREAPGQSFARGAWSSVLAVLALALTAFIAPHLWKKDTVSAKLKRPVTTLTATGQVCCPDVPVPHERVREYFSPLRVEAHAPPVPLDCVECVDGVALVPGGTGPDAVATTGGANDRTGAGAGNRYVTPRPIDFADSALPPSGSAPRPPPTPPAPARAVAAVAAKPPNTTAPATDPSEAPTSPYGPPDALSSGVSFDDAGPLAWLTVLAASALALRFALRPVRRLLVLRHLRSPLWHETVDQRVSNLWQLALVGLRDAGLWTAAGEAPHALARRAGFEGMTTCATVLERARHGVRIDAADLEAMDREAAAVYREARRGLRWPTRAISWLRWPLV
jgi:hypothetical protein